jgi:molybdate transport system substrate-binding protein
VKWRIVIPLVVVVAVLVAASVWMLNDDDDAPAPTAAPGATTTTIPGAGLDDGLAEPVSGRLQLYGVPATLGILELLKVGFEATNPDADLTVETKPAIEMLARIVDAPDPGVYIAAKQSVASLKGLSGAIGDPQPFGRNVFVIAVPRGNPGNVTGLDAFATGSSDRKLICGPVSGYGNLAELVLDDAGVEFDPADVGQACGKQAVDQIAAGDLDLALVQRTSVRPSVSTVAVPDDVNIVAELSIAQVGDDPVGAAFLTFVRSPAGRSILTDRGYLP